MNRYHQRTAFILLTASALLGNGCQRDTAPMLAYNRSNAQELRNLFQKGQKAEAEAAATSTAEPTGWATLSGKFTLNGTAPPRAPLSVNKDLEVCAPAGMQALDESLVVGPGNGIKDVLIFLGSAIPTDNPQWLHPSYAEVQTGEVLFDQKNCIFLSHVAAMSVNQRMKVMNSDPVGHNTNLDSKRGAAAGNFTVPANAFAYYEPGRPSPAPFPVSCSIHPWMRAWVMVCESPYFAVTAEDGSFEIKNLPAGVPLEFRVWQEKSGFLQTVSVDGQSQKWSKGKFTLTLNPDEPKQLAVAIDASVFQ